MKKTYLMPESIIVKIELTALLVESLGVNTDSNEEIQSSSDILSRRGGVWDDED